MERREGKRMSGWIAIAVSVVMAVITASIAVGVIRARLDAIAGGQDELQKEFVTSHIRLETSLSDLNRAVAMLTTTGAVNIQQHAEFSRRIELLESMILDHTQKLGTLRTRTHMHASKLQEIDPKWKPYIEGEG